MKISIITAVFNRAATIGSSLISLKSQTYKNIEHVIVDGASTDGTLDIIKKYAVESTVIVSESDSGIYNALNKGISLCTGEVVGILHSDDMLADEHVLCEIAEMFLDPAVNLVYGDLQYIDSNAKYVVRLWKAGKFSRLNLFLGWMPPHPTMFMRREWLNSFVGYDESYNIAADYEFILRSMCSKDMNYRYIPRVLVNMRVGGESNQSFKKIFRKTREDLRAAHSLSWAAPITVLVKNLRKISQLIVFRKELKE